MTSRDPARLRQGLHPLTTTLGIFNASLHSPISAVSMSSSHLQSAQTPGSSTIQPYNPQEWVPSQAAVAERPVQFAGEAQGKFTALLSVMSNTLQLDHYLLHRIVLRGVNSSVR
ncbi:hypothetical protein ACHAPT_008049 [Fusarium lateritium]